MKKYTVYIKAGIGAHNTPSVAYAIAADGKPVSLKSCGESGAFTLERYQQEMYHGSRDPLLMPQEYFASCAQGFHATGDKSKPLSQIIDSLLRTVESRVKSEDRIHFVIGPAPWTTSGSSLKDDKKLTQEVDYVVKKYLLKSFMDSFAEE